MDEIRRIQKEKFNNHKNQQLKIKQKENDLKQLENINLFKEKINIKYNKNPLSKPAIKLVRFIKRNWFKNRINKGKDWFRLSDGTTISIEEALMIDFQRDIDIKRKERLIKCMFQLDPISYWQKREFEASSLKDNPNMELFELECIYNYEPPKISYYPFIEEWTELFPFLNIDIWIKSYSHNSSKDEDYESMLKRLYRIYNNFQSNIIENKIFDIINKIKYSNKIISQKPVYNNKCCYCDTSDEKYWVYAFNDAFQVCRQCALEIPPSNRTAIRFNDNDNAQRRWRNNN